MKTRLTFLSILMTGSLSATDAYINFELEKVPEEITTEKEQEITPNCAEAGEACETQSCCAGLKCVAFGGNWGWYQCVVN